MSSSAGLPGPRGSGPGKWGLVGVRVGCVSWRRAHAVLLVGEDEVARRNAAREHRVPSEVLAAQLERFGPPYPGQAHRAWYVGPDGTVQDVTGTLDGEDV